MRVLGFGVQLSLNNNSAESIVRSKQVTSMSSATEEIKGLDAKNAVNAQANNPEVRVSPERASALQADKRNSAMSIKTQQRQGSELSEGRKQQKLQSHKSVKSAAAKESQSGSKSVT